MVALQIRDRRLSDHHVGSPRSEIQPQLNRSSTEKQERRGGREGKRTHGVTTNLREVRTRGGWLALRPVSEIPVEFQLPRRESGKKPTFQISFHGNATENPQIVRDDDGGGDDSKTVFLVISP
ncbi:hypothetical protein CRG98_004169 [Punica granatum]|uniref:Uncharacterized protein n=1 Tax=Punica granatum TaxID=22663 RepID=A0A2I0L458_PUNGR|nr:hypothetical protein CRG98_004169 [Punica granatum]